VLLPLRRVAVALTAAGILLAGGCGPKSAPDVAAPAGTGAAATAGPTSQPGDDTGTADPGAEATPSPTADTTGDDASNDDASSDAGSSADPATPPPPSPAPRTGSAQALLATLAVKGRGPLTGYTRDRYGQAWADVDRNGCDTRNDILRRDLVEVVLQPGTADCVVRTGKLDDPYTGRRIDFVRGQTTSTAVQIDHVVALADSWVTGAAAWDERKRIALANDPLNLLAVDGPANEQKGAGDAATWLPRAAYRCSYVARQIAVKAKYGLAVKPAERDAMNRVLDTCPGQPAPAYGPVQLPPPGLGAAAPAAPASTPAPTGGGGLDPRFPYCTDAKAAGYGPYVQGRDPEYDWYRDADHDGVVCE
jgi:hypothetical protein